MRHYLTAEDGAVTVDWTVLTAAAVALALATIGAVSVTMRTTTADVGEVLEADIPRDFDGLADRSDRARPGPDEGEPGAADPDAPPSGA